MVVPAPPPSAPKLDEASVQTKSHEYYDAHDREDVAAVQAALSPSFVDFAHERFRDGASIAKGLQTRIDRHGPAYSRTWDHERVFIGESTATFIGHSIVKLPPDGDAPAGEIDGWNTLVWAHEGGAWKVVLSEYVKTQTEGEGWDEAFTGFAQFRRKPTQLLVDTVQGVKPGTALDIAMGQGRNALFLATQGWKTTGIDVSKEGLKQAREKAAELKVKLDAVEADMGKYDYGKNKWDLVTMIYAGPHAELLPKIKPSIKKGGLFVTEYFHIDSMASKSGASGWKSGELKALFTDGWEILRDDEVEDTADWSLTKQKLVRFVARKK